MTKLKAGIKDMMRATDFARDLDYYGSLAHFYNLEQEMQLQNDAIIRGHMETQYAMVQLAKEKC